MTPPRRLGPLLACLMSAVACAPEPAGVQGEAVKGLYDIFLVVAAVVFLVVSGLIAWSIWRYREKEGGTPSAIKANVKLELAWFAIPTVMVVVLFALSVGVLDEVNEEVAEPSLTVNVEGFQWGWRFDYEGTPVRLESVPQKPAEIVLPVGETIAFFLVSNDVIHNFHLPDFLMKRDVVPGQTNRIDITIAKEGSYGGACAEFCGLLHDKMTFSIKAVSPQAFDAWMEQQAEEV